MAIKNSIDSQLPIPIADGGTGETTRQSAIDALTDVSAATAGQVLTKDGSGNATFQPATPIGSVIMFTGSTAPSGWLICDGSEISRTAYSSLFSVCGETYGVGDTTTTFNIPDLRQKFVLGKSASGTGSTLGETGGEIDHDHSVPSHYHGKGNLNITSSGTHTTSISHDHASFTASGTTSTSNPSHTHEMAAYGTNDFSHQHDRNQSSGEGFATVPEPGGSEGTYTTESANLTHAHPFSVSINVPSYSATSASTGAHTHASSSFSGSVGDTGGVNGDATMSSGSNNPPYLVLNYIIKAE
jgi:microcystin-dependent protein